MQKSQYPAIFDQPFSNSIILQDKGNHNHEFLCLEELLSLSHEGGLDTRSSIDFDDFVSLFTP